MGLKYKYTSDIADDAIKGKIPEAEKENQQIDEIKRKGMGGDLETPGLDNIQEILRKRFLSRIQQATNELEIDNETLDYRKNLLKKHFEDRMEEPSFEGGPYASKWHVNYMEIMPKIINLKEEAKKNIYFFEETPVFNMNKQSESNQNYYKERLILKSLLQNIQNSLPEKENLTHYHLNDCFTNISQLQMKTIIDVLAKSGVELYEKTASDRWKELCKK
jgi:hypothetical protein